MTKQCILCEHQIPLVKPPIYITLQNGKRVQVSQKTYDQLVKMAGGENNLRRASITIKGR